MIVADLLKGNTPRVRTIGDLQRETLRKSLGDGDDDQVQRLNEQLHDHVIPAFKLAWNHLVAVTAAGNAMMDPAAKAANKIAGRDADAEVERLRSQRFSIEKAIAAESRRAAIAVIRETVVDTGPELRKMREAMVAHNAGLLKLDERARRLLVDRLGKAEMALAKAL